MSQTSLDSLDLTPRHELGLHQLRRWRAGELAVPEQESVQRHLDLCSVCRRRIEELSLADAQVRTTLPFEKLADGVARRSIQVRRAPRWVAPVGLALAASLALVAVPPLLRPRPSTGLKGGGSDLQLYVGGVSEPRRVLGEAVLQPSERVRLEYAAGEHRYLAVLSIDEQGLVTPLYPAHGQSQPIGRGEERMLPDSVAFDGVGRERLVAVFSDHPFPIDELVATAHFRFATAGALSKMPPLGVSGEEIDRTVVKPGTP